MIELISEINELIELRNTVSLQKHISKKQLKEFLVNLGISVMIRMKVLQMGLCVTEQ